MMTIFEVLGYGPIVAKDEEFGLLVTVNGAYLNLWVQRTETRRSGRVPFYQPKWESIDCRSGHPDLYTLTVAKAMDLAEQWLREIRGEAEEQGEDDDDPSPAVIPR